MNINQDQTNDVVVDHILSHRINEDKCKYEYNVQMKCSKPWVAEDFLIKFHKDLLHDYKLTNGLSNIISETSVLPYQRDATPDTETNQTHSAKWLAINFNNDFGIKCEICVTNNEIENFQYKSNDVDLRHSISYFDDDVIKVKDECVDIGMGQIVTSDTESIATKAVANKNSEAISINSSNKLTSNSTKEITESVPDTSQIVPDQTKQTLTDGTPADGPDSMHVVLSQLLVANKIQIDVRDSKILHPITDELLRMIVDRGDIDLLQEYIFSEHRSLLMSLIELKPTVIVMAAARGDVHVVAALISLGANVNATDANLETALMQACFNENEALIDLLVNNGATMNLKQDGSNDVLFQCLSRNKPRAVSTLLNLGANFTDIYLRPPYSLEGFAKQMKNEVIFKILENHILSLSKNIYDLVSLHLGPHVKIVGPVMPIQVHSTCERTGEDIRVVFNAQTVPQIAPNRFSILFLVSGLILSSGLKCMLTDCNKITSVTLNDVVQHCLTPSTDIIVTTFHSLKTEDNVLKINFNPTHCRKLRLILAAYDVLVMD